MSLLERRLDNVVHRLGFGHQPGPGPADDSPRPHHRQRPARVDIPSYLVRAGDVIRVKNRAKSLQARAGATWPSITATCPISCRVSDGAIPEGRVDAAAGGRRRSRFRIQTQLIVELCSQ